MIEDHPELLGVVTLVVLAFSVAAGAYRSRREMFDPRVFFVLLYAYLTVSPCLFAIFTSEPYHPGLKIDELSAVLFSCCTAIAGFAVGSTLAIQGAPLRKWRPEVGRLNDDQFANSIVRNLLIGCCLITMACMGYYGFLMRSDLVGPSFGKAYLLQYADPHLVRNYRFYSSGCLLCQTLFIITDSTFRRGTITWASLVLVGAYALTCFVNGERDALIVMAVWLAANWAKLSRMHVFAACAACLLWLGVGPMLRQHGLGWGNQLNAAAEATFLDWLYPVMHMSSNLHVYTNVMDAVPFDEPHWHGRSLLSALASFVPGDFPLKSETPARWFAEVYDHQRLAGYGFSQDAEAYLNFGWLGPPFWFGAWGYLLAAFYRRMLTSTRTIDLFIWWHVAATSVFAIRSDTRGLAKMAIFGVFCAVILWKSAEVLAYLNRRRMPHLSRVRL